MKKAFNLIELIFVVIVIGIIATATLPNLNKNNLSKAAIQVATHIRYTQHLAMVDDKYDSSDASWYKARWQLLFGQSSTGTRHTNGKFTYTIFSDTFKTKSGKPDFSSINHTEIARDPFNRSKVLSGGYSGTLHYENDAANKNLNLGLSYGIKNVKLFGGCSYSRISFDYLGRPMKGNSSSLNSAYMNNRLLTKTCKISLCTTEICTKTKSDTEVIIAIEPETGYVYIL